MNLGDKIAQLRKDHNYTQEQLAELMDVSRQSVSKWESGVANPDLDKLIKLSDLYGCTIDYLLRDELYDSQGSVRDMQGTQTIGETSPSEMQNTGGTFDTQNTKRTPDYVLNQNMKPSKIEKVFPFVLLLAAIFIITAVTILVVQLQKKNDTQTQDPIAAQASIEQKQLYNCVDEFMNAEEKKEVKGLASAKELSQFTQVYYTKKAGKDINFNIYDITIPFGRRYLRYEFTRDEKAVISYIGDEQTLKYYKFLDDNDITPIEFDVKDEQDSQIEDGNIIIHLKGHDESYSYACWNNDGFGYALVFAQGISKDEIIGYYNQIKGRELKEGKYRSFTDASQFEKLLGFNIQNILLTDKDQSVVSYKVYKEKVAMICYDQVSTDKWATICKAKTSDGIFEEYLQNECRYAYSYDTFPSYEQYNDTKIAVYPVPNQLDKYMIATWTSGDYTYCILSEKYTTKEHLLDMAYLVLDQIDKN